jgi:ketosteroid isomerase-like protein
VIDPAPEEGRHASLIARAYDAINARELAALGPLCDPDVEWRDPPRWTKRLGRTRMLELRRALEEINAEL